LDGEEAPKHDIHCSKAVDINQIRLGTAKKGREGPVDTRLQILSLSFGSMRLVVRISKNFDGDLDAGQRS
jgi:hypothetical protein